MADTLTTHYSLIKPEPGAANTTWGISQNAAFDIIDSTMFSISSSVPLASTTTPLMDGAAAIGAATTWAKADHVHPTDTSRAPLASPTFTGTPAAPTAAPGDSTTKLATTAFVANALTAGTPGSSSANPLMNGVAAPGSSGLWSRGDHVHPTDTSRYAASNPSNYQTAANVTATLGSYSTTAAIAATYAPLASPSLTGNPTAPTQAALNNSTRIATTAYADGAVASAAFAPTLYSTVTVADQGGTSLLLLSKNSSGFNSSVGGQTAGSNRWVVVLGNVTAESGSNVGSDFAITRYTDAGAVVDSPITITRSNGNITFLGGSSLSAAGRFVSGQAYGCRPGNIGGLRATSFNIDYTGTVPQLWVDGANLGTFSFVSDYRMKDKVKPLASMWDTIKTLNPISYSIKDWTPDWSDEDPDTKEKKTLVKADDTEQWGFIAHELQEALIPSAANGVKDAPHVIQSPNPWTVIAVLTKTLQEAISRIEQLEHKAP